MLVWTDNIAAKAQVNKQGEARWSNLHKEAMVLFHWVETRLLSIRADYIKGKTTHKRTG